MIPARFITAWRQQVPWQSDFQVEQDLLISRVLVELYQIPLVNKKLAFRGGTALNKLFIIPPARFNVMSACIALLPGNAWRGRK